MVTSPELMNELSYFLAKNKEASQWAEDYASSAGSANPVILKQKLFEIAKSLNKYKKALDTRPAVGLFGESQSGKSFLVSLLGATPGNTSVEVVDRFSGKRHDFLQVINPKGNQKESTGVVTRFTVVPVNGSQSNPYVIKLFSQPDLVKIIANGYFLDFKEEAIREFQFKPEEFYTIVSKLKSKKLSYRYPEFTEEDVLDIKNYLERNASKSMAVFNTSSYWEDAVSLIPYISFEERWEILQYLWGNNEFFTSVFNTLSLALGQTDFSKVLQVGEEAILPRERSIIDIDRCLEILDRVSASTEYVNVICETGKRTKTAKNLLGALTAELEVNLPEELVQIPDMEFLKESDILDFPGCRSREQYNDHDFKKFETRVKLGVFRRGKVAFLFEKYTHDFSITTLITCIPDRVLEVKQLANYLYEWVKLYMGDDPQKRLKRLTDYQTIPEFSGKPVTELIPLLVALTIFDRDLMDKGISMRNDDPDRFQGRFFQNYYQFFGSGRIDNYLETWLLPTEERHFKNTFPIRNPNAGGANIFTKQEKNGYSTETDISDEYKKVLPDVKKAFCENIYVKKLTKNPDQLFESVASPGNHGASNLLKALNIVCRTKLKERLIYRHFQETKEEFIATFKQFDWDSDAGQAMLNAKTNAAKVFGAITLMQSKKATFGALLNCLNLKEEIAYGVYFKLVNSSPVQNQPVNDTLAGAEEKISLSEYAELMGIPVSGQEDQKELLTKIKNYWGIDSDEAIINILEAANVDWKVIEKKKPKDKTDTFCEDLLTKWGRTIEEIKSAEVCNALGIKADTVSLVIEQLNKSLVRVQLKSVIADSVREEIKNYHPVNNPNFDIVSQIATSTVNKFVNSFAWQFEPAPQRPTTPKNEVIFDESNIIIPKKSLLVNEAVDGDNNIFNNWRIGLKESFERNLKGHFESPAKLLAMSKLKDIMTPLTAKP